MSTVTARNSQRAITLAVALYLAWVVATYLLEGRLLTLQGPDATLVRVL